ncbi:MATE family efflux transporter [Haloimpatiens massiliensis]|uniref:MATE family efflux transporter n=1 Tax=Haloimpatiens massiliensis TaxID=1658110 RepID=UPI001FA838A3|nr:MATE family efflux transporter [Haloimpatiens massiliensis]
MEICREKEELKEIRKKIFYLILPITLESILEMSVGLFSMAMVGRLGEIAIGSIGIGSRIANIVWAIFKGITIGAGVFVAQAYGAKKMDKLRNVIQQTILSSLILVIVIQQIIFWNAPKILSIFKPDAVLLSNAAQYLRIVSFGLPFLAIMLIAISVLQSMGDAKTPFYMALVMNIVNIGFGFLFIFGKLGFPKLGLRGAAVATVLAQFVGSCIAFYVFFRKNGVLNPLLNKNFFQLNLQEVKSIYRVGIPSSMESLFWQLSAIILTRIMLKYGNTVFAAYQLGLQAESISFMPAAGFGIAATTFIGQCVGARDGEKGKKYLKEIMKGSMMITAVTTIILVFFPHGVLRMLTDKENIIVLGVKYLIIMGVVQIAQNASGVLNGALRGAGYTKVPMIVSGIGLWCIRIPASLFLAYVLKTNIVMVWIAMGIDLVIRFFLSFYLYKVKNIYDTETVLD